MPIAPEHLNAQLIAHEVHAGVYQNYARRTAIVVKVKNGRVWYLHYNESGRIVLEHMVCEQFLTEWFLELYHYPVLRAVRKFAKWVRDENCPITDEARKVINAIIAR